MSGLTTDSVPVVRAALPERPASELVDWLLMMGAILGAAGAAYLAFSAPAGERIPFAWGYFAVDATSRLFLLLVNLVFLGIAAYIINRVRAEPLLRQGLPRFVALALGFVLASDLAILSNHLIAGWVCLELTTLLAVPLIQHGGGAAATRASWKYFLFSIVGLALTLLGFSCLARGMEASGHHPTFFVDALVNAGAHGPEMWQRVGLVLIILGLGTKLGLAPMYAWLPETYEAAPPAVTAMLASVQFNVALVALLRVIQIYRISDPYIVELTLVPLGLATMAVSAFGVMSTHSYKRLIAYTALNHGGVIAIGLGIGKVAAYGLILYAVSNGFIKAILFLTAGKIRSHYKTNDLREVRGLIKDLPYSGLFFAIGIFALLGFPPFGSFLGELIIMSALIEGGWFGVFAAFCAILMVTFTATGRSVFPMIWGAPKQRVTWGSQPLGTLIPKAIFMTLLIAMGLFLPVGVNVLFREVASTLGAL